MLFTTFINENTMPGLILSLLLGLLLMWLLLRGRLARLGRDKNNLTREIAVEKERSANMGRRADELGQTVREQDAGIDALRRQAENDKVRIAELGAELNAARKNAAEKITLWQEAEKKMTDAFENLSNRILEEKSRKFTDQNRRHIGEVLNPLREQLGDFRKKIEDVYDKESKDRSLLQHEISGLKSLNAQMSRDAINLTRALKGDSKKRGDWGEVVLERVLEDSGLCKGREYQIQASYRDAANALYRPDVVVHLPDQRDVIIDSKVSLLAYERYYAAEEETARQAALKEHLRSIRAHVDGLKAKGYGELIGLNSLDMVLMFVAIEPALMLALEQDDSLFQDAFKNGIFLVSPSTLSLNLQVIQNMWRYEYQSQNAREIAKRAGDMYDKFVGFTEALGEVGDRLDKAQGAWRTAHNRLLEGRGNLVARAEAIRKLGELRTGKQLPPALIRQAADNDEQGRPEQGHSDPGHSE